MFLVVAKKSNVTSDVTATIPSFGLRSEII